MTDSYERAVRAHLRNEYGVRAGPVLHGGSHPTLRFVYGGSRRVVTLQNPGNRGSWEGHLAEKYRDIRRELGPPPNRKRKERMKLSEMIPTEIVGKIHERIEAQTAGVEPAPMAREISGAKIAKYKRNTVRIFLRTEDAVQIFGGRRVLHTQRGSDTWALRADSASAGSPMGTFHPYSRKTGLSMIEISCALSESRWGVSPVEASVINATTLMVRSDPATRVAIRHRLAKRAADPKPVSKPNGTDVVEAKAATRALRPDRERLLACLRTLRDIMAAGTHELVRLKSGKYRFVPAGEIVELED